MTATNWLKTATAGDVDVNLGTEGINRDTAWNPQVIIENKFIPVYSLIKGPDAFYGGYNCSFDDQTICINFTLDAD